MPQATQLESVKPGLTRPLAAPELVVFTMTLDSSPALENPPALALLPWAPRRWACGARGPRHRGGAEMPMLACLVGAGGHQGTRVV